MQHVDFQFVVSLSKISVRGEPVEPWAEDQYYQVTIYFLIKWRHIWALPFLHVYWQSDTPTSCKGKTMVISCDLRQSLADFPIDLPVFHPVALKLTIMLSDPYSDIDDVIKTINEDQALASQVLKMSNSAAYVGLVKSETIKEAVVRLGAGQISMLTMAASQASLHVSANSVVNEIMKELWQHSLVTALGCWWVAQHTGHQSIVDHAYMAGLLHDIGKLHLLKALEHLTLEKQIVVDRELVLAVFTEMHVEQGDRIMRYWNIPPVYQSVAFHHHDATSNPIDSLLTMVRLVNKVSRKVGISLDPEPFHPEDIQTEMNLLDMDGAQFEKLESVLYSYRDIHV